MSLWAWCPACRRYHPDHIDPVRASASAGSPEGFAGLPEHLQPSNLPPQKRPSYVRGLEKTIEDAEEAGHALGYERCTVYLADLITDLGKKLQSASSAPPEQERECLGGDKCACIINTRHEWCEAYIKEREINKGLRAALASRPKDSK